MTSPAVAPVSGARRAIAGLSTRGFPPGAVNANRFNMWNALSWQIALGAPVILYARSLEASKLVLGIIGALMPLLVILQIPAAHLIPRLGYRRMMLMGWTSRTLFIFGLAAVPLLPGPNALRLGLVLLMLFLFTGLRGLSSGLYLPWMSELIPAPMRGHFFARDQFFTQAGSMLALCGAAAALSGHTQPWQFSIAFGIGAVGGTISLIFIRRIPEVGTPEQRKRSGARVPWMAMLRFRPFFRLIVFNVQLALVIAGLRVFSVDFLRSGEDFSQSTIILLATLSVLGALLTLPWSGLVMDRVGSKPVFRVCVVVFMLVLAGWCAVAAGLVPHAGIVIGVLFFLLGMAGVNFAVANVRMQAATIPIMGRNHFFALLTVIASLAQGLSPIAWGAMLDAIGDYHRTVAGADLNRYSIYFGITSVLCLGTLAYSFWLEEAPAGTEAHVR